MHAVPVTSPTDAEESFNGEAAFARDGQVVLLGE